MNSGHVTLTPNAIRTMYQMDSSMDNEFFVPILQVLRLKKLNENGAKKWVGALSDGQRFLHGEFDSGLHEMIHDHLIAQNAIIRLQHFDMSTRGDRKVCYIFDAEQAALNPGTSLGSPVDVRLNGQTVGEVEPSTPGIVIRTAVPPSDCFYSVRSKPRWQNGYRDAQVRKGMIGSIESVLKNVETEQRQSDLPAERKEELKKYAAQWELKLYEQAHSFEEYVNMSTFSERLKDISRSAHSQREVFLQQHQRLHLWRHAMMCNESECTLSPFCSTIRDVCDHIEGCHMQNCQVPFCSTFKQLMHHSMSCRDVECQICEPTLRVEGCVFCEDEERKKRGKAIESPKEDVQTSLKQEYLLTMFHASTCPHEEDGKCLLSPLCFDLKKVWMHKVFCTKRNCQFPFCSTSKVFTDHYHSCSLSSCQVCPPVRATRTKYGISRLKAEMCQEVMDPPTEVKFQQKVPTKDGADSSDPNFVESQVAIYKDIQQRNKRRLSPSYDPTSNGNPVKDEDEISEDDAAHGLAAMNVDDADEHHPTRDISPGPSRSNTNLQISEYQRLNKAYQQFLQASDCNGSIQSIANSDLDGKPAALQCDSSKKSHSSESSGSCREFTESPKYYLATTYPTKMNTEPVTCLHCQTHLFTPSTLHFFCQECRKLSRLEGRM